MKVEQETKHASTSSTTCSKILPLMLVYLPYLAFLPSFLCRHRRRLCLWLSTLRAHRPRVAAARHPVLSPPIFSSALLLLLYVLISPPFPCSALSSFYFAVQPHAVCRSEEAIRSRTQAVTAQRRRFIFVDACAALAWERGGMRRTLLEEYNWEQRRSEFEERR